MARTKSSLSRGCDLRDSDSTPSRAVLWFTCHIRSQLRSFRGRQALTESLWTSTISVSSMSSSNGTSALERQAALGALSESRRGQITKCSQCELWVRIVKSLSSIWTCAWAAGVHLRGCGDRRWVHAWVLGGASAGSRKRCCYP